MSDSLWPHGLQHARLFCPPVSYRVCSNSRSLSQWCYLTIWSSAAPFSFCLYSFPSWGSFLMCQLFASCGQSIGASASASTLPMIIQGWFPLGLTALICLLSKGFSRIFSNTSIQKHQFFSTQPSLWSNSQHPSMTTGDTIASIIWTFVSKLMSLLFNTLSRFVSFPSKEQTSFNFMATVTIHTYLCSCVYMYTPIHSSSLHLKINWLHPWNVGP